MTGETHTFFIDKCLTGRRFRRALLGANLAVVSPEDHFPEDCEDYFWLGEVSKRGWVVITKDRTLLDNPREFDAICDFAARVILYPEANLPSAQIITRFSTHLPAILDALATRPAPLIIVLYPDAVDILPPLS